MKLIIKIIITIIVLFIFFQCDSGKNERSTKTTELEKKDLNFTIYDKKIKPAYVGRTGIKFNSQAIISVLIPSETTNDEILKIGEYISNKMYSSIYEINIFFYNNTESGKRMARDEFYEPKRSELKDYRASYIKSPQWNNGKPMVDFTPWD